MKTLRDVVPYAFFIEYENTLAYKFLDVEVLEEFDGFNPYTRWPGTHKHVVSWWKLANGKSVGWNENVCRGWSFPVIKTK